MALEHALLLLRGQAGVQGHDLPVRAAAARSLLTGFPDVVLQGVRGVADLPFAGEEDEDVAGFLPRQLVERVDDPLDLVLDRTARGPAAGEVLTGSVVAEAA